MADASLRNLPRLITSASHDGLRRIVDGADANDVMLSPDTMHALELIANNHDGWDSASRDVQYRVYEVSKVYPSLVAGSTSGSVMASPAPTYNTNLSVWPETPTKMPLESLRRRQASTWGPLPPPPPPDPPRRPRATASLPPLSPPPAMSPKPLQSRPTSVLQPWFVNSPGPGPRQQQQLPAFASSQTPLPNPDAVDADLVAQLNSDYSDAVARWKKHLQDAVAVEAELAMLDRRAKTLGAMLDPSAPSTSQNTRAREVGSGIGISAGGSPRPRRVRTKNTNGKGAVGTDYGAGHHGEEEDL